MAETKTKEKTNKEKHAEHVRSKLLEKIKEYNLNERIDKIPKSDSYVKVKYNDGTEDIVDPLSEFYLCKKYFPYFVDKYGYFLDAANKRVSGFKLFRFQKDLIVPYFLSKKYVIFRKCRQVGASVLSGQYALWLANFNIAQDVLIISKTRTDAQDFKSKAMVTYERMPSFLKTKPTRDGQNMTTLKLTNKSRIVTRAQSPDAGRGGTWSLVILDEAAFMPYADEIWSSVYPSLGVSDGQCFIISTSNGVGNFYHKMWIGAENKENDFHPIYIPWWKFPGRSNPWLEKVEQKDIDWIEEQLGDEIVKDVHKSITKKLLKDEDDTAKRERVYEDELIRRFIHEQEQAQLSFDGAPENKPWLKRMHDNSDTYRRFAQEILAEFLGSGNTVISADALKKIEAQQKEPLYVDKLEEKGDPIKGLVVFEDPQMEIGYTATIDVASGAGQDYSTILVFRDDTLEQVAEYKKQLDTKEFAVVVKQVCRHFNQALAVIETNQGQSVFNDVFLHETDPYLNVFFEMKGKTYRGLHTSAANKKLMIDEFLHNMENNIIKIYGKRTIEELKVYIWHNGKPQASRGYNDDLVLPVMFLAYLIKYGGQKMKALGFATADQTIGLDRKDDYYQESIDQLTEEEVKNKVEENLGVDWETYQWLVQ